MTTVIAEHELFDSCRVLFGEDLQVSRSFLEYLQRAGIKSAYRQKALTTHPDILASQGDTAKAQSAELFRLVQQAYENLTTYLDARDNGFRFQLAPRVRAPQAATAKTPARPAQRPQDRKGSAAGQSRSTTGPSSGCKGQSRPASAWQTSQAWPTTAIPARRLLFGHYLYYSGVTTWQTLVKALVWQRTGRPRLGEIGRRFGWLTDQDILTVLKKRKLSESFGSSAVALGLLTDSQLRLMIFQQGKLQKKIGDYFIQHKLISPLQLNELASNFTRHNASCDRQRFAFSARM